MTFKHWRSAIGTLAVAAQCGGAMATWVYSTDADKMTGKAQREAEAVSDNSLSLDFPYKGRNHGTLIVRNDKSGHPEAIIIADQGQMLCHRYGDGCSVTVRFDDNPPKRFSGTQSSDNNPRVIFINDARGFVAGAAKAKKILVQATFFHNGLQIFEFTTPQPLTWGPSTDKPKAPNKKTK